MPEPAKKESLKDWVSHVMADRRDRKWSPKQRAAIAYSEFKEKRKREKT